MANYIPNAFNYTPGLCKEHVQPDCGCSGYPTLQEKLRDCGDARCIDARRYHKCLQHQAADMIDRYKIRSERYLDRIIHLQDIIERYETIRDLTNAAWETQPKTWDND